MRTGRALTVLNVAYPMAPVGADAVGGAEQILTHLDFALMRAGHRSVVVACDGSVTAGALVATPVPAGELNDAAKARVHEQHRANIVRALDRWPVDVIHLHGIDFDRYLPPAGAPALATLHLPPDWYDPAVWRLDRPNTWLNCVSASQRRACPPCPTLLPEIDNGVPVAALAQVTPPPKREYCLALGRICPEKNFHAALDAGVAAGVPVLLAGQVFPYAWHEQYFRTEIAARLDDRRCFIGPVGFERKRRLLAGARALLAPSLAPETSSLVAMEALACGTPVVAYPAGALPEIVEHGRTGFIVHDVSEMAEAIRRADTLDPEVCRDSARRRFSLTRMTEQYLALYERLACAAEMRSRVAGTARAETTEARRHAA